MLNLTVILKEVPKSVMIDLPEVLQQAKLNNMQVDASINHALGYVYIDVESQETGKTFALAQLVDVIDYASIGEYVTEIGVE